MNDREILKLYADGGPGGLLSHRFIVIADSGTPPFVSRSAVCHCHTVEQAREHVAQFYSEQGSARLWQRGKRKGSWIERCP